MGHGVVSSCQFFVAITCQIPGILEGDLPLFLAGFVLCTLSFEHGRYTKITRLSSLTLTCYVDAVDLYILDPTLERASVALNRHISTRRMGRMYI